VCGLVCFQIHCGEDGLSAEWIEAAAKQLSTEAVVSRQLLENHVKTVDQARVCRVI
jgi:hypothetical protein